MIFIQKKLFRGRQEFRLQEDDQLLFTFKGGGAERSFTVSLALLNPRPERIKTLSFGYLFAAVPTGLFAALLLLVAVVGLFLHKNPAPTIQGFMVGGVFAGISFLCFRENSRKCVDVVAFYNRYNGKAVLTPWYHKPNPAAFDAFVKELSARITAATQRASEAPNPQNVTMAGEILALKKLVDDGVLSASEFERAKGKLLETSGERRPIGFSA